MGLGLHFDLAKHAVRNDGDSIKLFLQKGADPLAKSKEGATALMFAVDAHCLDSVLALVDVSDLDARDCNGQTALMRAAVSRVQYFDDGGAGIIAPIMRRCSDEVIQAKDLFGMDALMHAARDGNLQACKELLPRSDPAARDRKGRTALMHAVGSGSEQLVELLLPSSDPMAKDAEGCSALDHADPRRSEPLHAKLARIQSAFEERMALEKSATIDSANKAKPRKSI